MISMETVCFMALICSCCWACFLCAFLPRKYSATSAMIKIARITSKTIDAVFMEALLGTGVEFVTNPATIKHILAFPGEIGKGFSIMNYL